MNVLHLMGEMDYGGAELMTIEISSLLLEKSVSVTIAIIGHCDSGLAEYIKSKGIGLVLLDSGLNSFVGFVKTFEVIRSGKYDIVHAHLFPAFYYAALCSLLINKKLLWIYSEHSTDNKRRKKLFFRFIEKFIYKSYDKVVCISADVRKSLVAWQTSLSNVVAIDNGINIEKFRNAEPLGREEISVAPDDLMILMVGAFREEKNQKTLLKSLLYLPVRYKLVFAGVGPLFDDVRRLSVELGVEDRVRFLGAVTNIERLMKTADVYVLPSLFEGFGLSAVEAAAAGLPVVYADVSGLGAVFGGVGVPVDPEDSLSVANGILHVFDDGFRYKELSDKSLELSLNYDIRVTAEQYYQLYSGAGVS